MRVNPYQPPQRVYKTLQYLGRVPARMQLRSKVRPYHMVQSMHAKRLHTYYNEMLEIASDKFVMVEPSLENVNKTIESFDGARFGEFRNKFLDFGCSYLEHQYGAIFKDCIMPSEELAQAIDWTKSAGYTATYHHIQTKGHLIQDSRYMNSPYALDPTSTVPMVSIANKKELKSKEDVLANKIRLFWISEFHLCQAQLTFGKRSSLRLKNRGWSAYGWTPFMGGVQELAEKLLSKPIRFFYDVSGWDKFIPLMKDLFKIIFKCSDIPKHMHQYFAWMVQHTCEFISVMYDGDVILKNYGNCSGSGTTTRDNILMHIIIAAAFLAEAYFIKNGVLPTEELLSEQVVKLFGDDSIFAVDVEFDYVLHRKDEPDGFLRSFFERFGMKLKFLHGGYEYPVDQMEFLGFRFTIVDGYYFPRYDPVRLATSFIYTNDRSDKLEAYLSKCFVLTMMAYASDKRELFLNAYRVLIESVRPAEITSAVKGFLSIGPLNKATLHAFYSGLEASTVDFSFFESALVEGGISDSFTYLLPDHEF